MTFNDDEIETIKALIVDYANDCPDVDWDKLQALGEKLGCLAPIPEPTEEELQARKDFAESPTGKQFSEMLRQTNDYMAMMASEQKSDFDFVRDVSWGTIKIKPGDTVRLFGEGGIMPSDDPNKE